MNRTRKIYLSPQDKESLQQVRGELEVNTKKRVTLPALAARAGMNRFKLTYGFRHLFGKSIHQYRQESRMEQAKALLLEKDKPIKTIAGLCGYSSRQNFSTMFKKYAGITPMQFQASEPG